MRATGWSAVPGSGSTGRATGRGSGRGRRRRAAASVAVTALVSAALFGGAAAASAAPPPSQAPGAPGAQATWTTGAKQGVGTSTTPDSKVWYTLSEGTLAEVYYPRVDVANSRSLELIVTDGSTFTDLESRDTTHEVSLADSRALVYTQVNTDKDGRYEVVKTTFTDPARSSVIIDISVRSLDGGTYQVFAQYDPSLANSGRHDSARFWRGALVAEDLAGDPGTGAEPIASALVADKDFLATSNGFAGISDGYTDLAGDHRLDHSYAQALDGNVVQTAQLKLTGPASNASATLALGFGASADAARKTATASLGTAGGHGADADAAAEAYADGWHDYLDSVSAAPASVAGDAELTTQYHVAAMTLKAHEDKTYLGANIASLTIPWGQAQNANEAGVGGYHLVWARDLYQVSTAQIALGDSDAANRSLDYLFEVQQKSDGSFPQNSLLDGTPYWGSLQLDEVAFPLVLAWQLGRTDATTYAEHVKKAADFLVSHGPSTPQERWEEEGGFSPSTIAAEIAGLTAAASIATANGDTASAAIYTGVADDWQRKVQDWTFTTTGPLGDGRYFERIDDNGDPNDGHMLEINNGGGTYDERSIVDAGFLDLVRLGVKPAADAAIIESLPEVDATIKVDTPNGALWYRYNHDGYGEKADGSPYNGTGVGRLWPLLSGERGEYELANGRPATTFLDTLAATANARLHDPRAGMGPAGCRGLRARRGHGLGDAAGLVDGRVRAARAVDRRGQADRDALRRRGPVCRR